MKVPVELRACEAIVAHGVSKTTWWLFDAGRWCSVRDFPDAQLHREDAPPGIVWQTRAELELPIGTWLMRVRTRPIRERTEDPLSYLRRESLRARWHSQRSYFRVGKRGHLQPADAAQAPQDPLDDERTRSMGEEPGSDRGGSEIPE